MKKITKSILLMLFLSILPFAELHSQRDSTSPERLKEYVRYLASEELEGRFPGTPGIEKAADFIREHFESNGLKKLNNSFYQSFSVATGVKMGADNKMAAHVLVERPGLAVEHWRPAQRNFQVIDDFQPLAFSESGSVQGDLFFAGYGISSDDLKYDDYEGSDVKGKIVIILAGSPDGKGDKSKYLNYLSMRYKAINARNKGAAGVIFVNPQGDSADVLKPFQFEMMSRNSGIYAVQMKRSVIARLFPKNALLNPTEAEINRNQKPKSFDIPHTNISMTIDLADDINETNNVVGLVEGTKYKDEYIVIGAHYDHLGWGQLGNSTYRGSRPMIHFGADDNASGVAALMELAERFAKQPAERSVVFIAFSAEEMGLLGSDYFVRNSPYPLEKTVMMINLDMIGRLRDNKLQMFGLGTGSDFENVSDSLSAIETLDIVKLNDGFGPSDHTSFYKNQIPVMHFFTGVNTDYHSPSDSWDKLNFKGISRVVDFAETMVKHYASAKHKPEYRKVEEASDSQSSRSHGRGSAWFGIIPNFEESPEGCKISGASPGSPAHKAGLIENDIITEINGKKVKNLHDFMYIVGEYKVGEVLKVNVLRGDKKMVFDVKLSSREK